MATAKVVHKPIEPVTPSIKEVVLTLTEAEARVIAAIGWRVGGSPSKSRRGLIQNITDALCVAGIYEPSPTDMAEGDHNGYGRSAIHFKETT
jgi:hypothetical protein